MKLFDRLFKRNKPEVPSLDAQAQNACHKLQVFRKMPMFASFSADQMKLEAEKKFKDIHFGPGYTPELVDYVWSGQYEAAQQEK